MKEFICVAKCPELDFDGHSHCRVENPEDMYERYVDGCPCGNEPEWEPVEIGGDRNG